MRKKRFKLFVHLEDHLLSCPKCGWTGSADKCLEQRGPKGIDYCCPKCPPKLAFKPYATLEQEAAYWSKPTVPKAWLQRRIDLDPPIEKLISTNKKQKKNEQTTSPEDMKKYFKEDMKKGDELWSFSSPQDSWELLCGQSGIALVRKGVVINTKVLMRN